MKVIYDISENSMVEVPLTKEEIEQKKIDAEKFELEKKLEQEKIVARQAILDRLGLTEEEARLLVG